MKYYEYRIEKFSEHSKQTEEQINYLGKCGWELISVTSSNGHESFYFKREIEK